MMAFRRLKPKRPSVVRVGDKVKSCPYYSGLNQCLGPSCFWIQVGSCKFYNRVKGRFAAK
jgi:hypothetical protein